MRFQEQLLWEAELSSSVKILFGALTTVKLFIFKPRIYEVMGCLLKKEHHIMVLEKQ